MAKRASNNHIPRSVSKKILERAARGERKIVVIIKQGKPSSVWGFDEYLAQQQRAKKVKPWRNRKGKVDVPDPLGAIEGAPVGPLTRDRIYEDTEPMPRARNAADWAKSMAEEAAAHDHGSDDPVDE